MLLTKTTKQSGQIVNSKHVESLLSNYKKERWLQNSNHIGKADSLSVWYSLDQLQAFLDTAKESGADGIKMYFGVYTPDTAGQEIYEDRQTIVLVATKEKELANGTVIDKNIYTNTGGKPEIVAFNVGRLCPPTCAGGGTGNGTGFDLENPGILIDKQGEGMIVI
ncbi:MAG: hypothetical protein ABIU63_15685 [Chitinophagaceae bacterium]